jgi:CheY-like chemotaxis protein
MAAAEAAGYVEAAVTKILMKMKNELTILMLEDVPCDAELVHAELKRSGLQFAFTRVDERDRFSYELINHAPDVVLSDHGLPNFDGFSALEMVRGVSATLPFIFVTGSLEDGLTARAFEQGATDCVLKDHLVGLAPAVKRALREAQDLRRLQEAEAEICRLNGELNKLQERLGALDQLFSVCSACKRTRDERNEWRQLEYVLHKRLGLAFSHGICPDCIKKFYTGFLGPA